MHLLFALVLDVAAQALMIQNENTGAVVLHASMNNTRLKQTEILTRDLFESG